jgi:hypothetical protein
MQQGRGCCRLKTAGMNSAARPLVQSRLHLGQQILNQEGGAMDSTIVAAVAALLGSLAGASASIFTTWLTQRSQFMRERTVAELQRRELLYEEFIKQASSSVIDSLSHSLDQPEKFVKLYANLSCIRLLSSQPVLDAAEQCCHQIVDCYLKPNMTVEEIRASLDHFDPLRDFSAICRAELHEMAQKFGRH